MDNNVALVVPVRFADVEVLVEVTETTVGGSEPVSATSHVVDAYDKAESAILAVTKSVAGTISRLTDAARRPKELQVEFGLSVTVEGDVLIAKGKAGATLAVTLT